MPHFDQYEADKPPIPDLTCPHIDLVKRKISSIVADLKYAAGHTDDVAAARAMDLAIDELEAIAADRTWRNVRDIPDLERLREQNEQLRASGIYWRDVADEVCARLDEKADEFMIMDGA